MESDIMQTLEAMLTMAGNKLSLEYVYYKPVGSEKVEKIAKLLVAMMVDPVFE